MVEERQRVKGKQTANQKKRTKRTEENGVRFKSEGQIALCTQTSQSAIVLVTYKAQQRCLEPEHEGAKFILHPLLLRGGTWLTLASTSFLVLF